MKLQEIERKVAALALDAACQGGELESSAVKFFTLLKKRGIKIEEFDSNGNGYSADDFSAAHRKIADLQRTVDSLTLKLLEVRAELDNRPVRFVHPKKAEVTGKVYDSMPFGKHAGKKFKDISKEYLEWVVQNVTNNPDLVRSIKEYLERTA